jgi:Tol biopolymer transport system component
MNANGSEPRQLTTGNLDVHPVASPDSRWVVYASFRGWSPDVGGSQTIWRVPIEGGEPVQITKDITSLPAVSPDGKLIAAAYFLLDQPQSIPKIVIYPFQGGPAVKIFDRPDGSDDKVYWAGDGNSLEYIVSRGDVSNIWRQSLQGGEPAPITHFGADRLFFLSPSPTGKHLALGRGKELTELVLITQGH